MDLEKIRTLLDFVGRSRVSELTVSEAGTTVVIRNPARAAAAGGEPAAAGSQASATASSGEEGGQADDRIVRSVSAGVLHRSASPGAAPLVAVGDAVEPGQTLCIVEAMKVFTTVSAPFGGTVRRIFFEDGQDVGFGDPLVEVV
ncbi:acetyl-CoA carboxylase biotin carboxyl carrier protein [Shinella pollutisoli]|uniref:Biotin carboxyl carrier protein of acetyl-CoA carboxylase n=1 Tax=Shinella pollutisoli TaxID=2250594 RepID=A0ABV7DAU5_9HYPH|nr:biotin/lipoyl-containing protein [Shinella pollutisoli]